MEYRNLQLPTVTVGGDLDKLANLVSRTRIPPEEMVDLIVYLNRIQKETDVIAPVVETLRTKIADYYAGLKETEREAVRGGGGMVTYTPAGTKDVLIDRDATVAVLSDEQLRVSYTPDLKAMKTILKPADYARLTRSEPTPAKITIRDTGGDVEL